MKIQETYLHSFLLVRPQNVYAQSDLIDWVILAHEKSQSFSKESNNLKRLKRFTLNENYIHQRYIECDDADENWEQHDIYHISKESPCGVDIEKRQEFYATRVFSRFEEIYGRRPTPDHLIHVTCTGYISPSAPQLYFSKKESAPAITHAYHMGCYASLPAIRMAQALAISEDKKIDIVHNEICSIHMNPNNHLPEQMVVQTLFADGHIAYRISSEKKDLRIIIIKEKLIPDSSDDMSWIPSPHGMQMTLSREVPAKIGDNVISFIIDLVKEAKLDLAQIIKNGVFAIHPGGPRIIDVVKVKLELRDEQIRESKEILFERGNMSSATLPHVWDKILQNKYPKGTPVISLAFGPGLTVFGSIFEVV